MGATRDIALTELPFRGISINPESGDEASIAIVPSDSGVIFINKETSSGTVTYTLPAVADGAGKWFWFFQGGAVELIVSCATASIVGDATGTTATCDSAQGACGFVIGDGTYYYLHEISGDWAVT